MPAHNRLDRDVIIGRFRSKHGDRYDYPGAYQGYYVKMEMTCPIHGSFWQTPSNHLLCNGCPRCRGNYAIVNGFDYSRKGFGRPFLTPEEHAVYLKWPPDRAASSYTSGRLKPPADAVCAACGKLAGEAGKMSRAHKVPFKLGVLKYGFTPDWLEGNDNTVWAHQGACNDKAELSELEIMRLIKTLK